jgi:Protein of unknown function (DUF2470)
MGPRKSLRVSGSIRAQSLSRGSGRQQWATNAKEAAVDHVDAMVLLAKSHAGVEAIEATMTSVDRLGFTLRLKTSDAVKGVRIKFLREVATAQDTRAVARRDGTASEGRWLIMKASGWSMSDARGTA